MKLETVCDDVWAVGTQLRLSPGFWLPIRATVLRKPEGGLVIHSPIRFDDAVVQEINALGPVEVIVAPSLYHHLFVADAKARWPKARVLAPSTLAAKRKDLVIDGVLTEDALGEQIRCIAIQGGPMVDEFVFVHRPSKTLLVTDLLFNIHETQGALTPWVLRMMGAWQGTAQSRSWRWLVVKDRAAFAASGQAILREEIQHIVFAHGDVLHHNAKETLRHALQWMLSGAAPQLTA
ncbi:MAG: DUF4336 domain-containing protein [Deltaproteobacteria bacterium]|nr:DUF4336 domain-containing protein [Deltaproteobacteria bacterium]